MVALDFAPGLHGHFLEYVINKYIYKTISDVDDIFHPSSGAAHTINTSAVYQSNKVVHQAHYSAFLHPYPVDTEKVIFIKHCPELDFVLLTNIYYRCHPNSVNATDFNVNEVKALHESLMQGTTDIERRVDWYTKLTERHFEHASRLPKTNLPVFDFDYKSFFNLVDFYEELNRLADFLNMVSKFDASLTALWETFMQRNQGWELYQTGNSILNSTLTNKLETIPDDWKLHAYINFRLSRLFRLYDGEIFDSTVYPGTTTELSNILTQHAENYDTRW